AQTPVAEPTTFIRQIAQPLAQSRIILVLFLILENRPVQIGQFTRPTLGQAMPIHHVRHGPALHVRR
ncbi:MAG: hypothetical protein AAF967_12105, partial [Pseudomonadota bacterium]